MYFFYQSEPWVGREVLKTDVKRGRGIANRFFCSRGFFSVILGHFQCLTEGSGMLITCGPDPDVQVWSSALYYGACRHY